MSFFLGIDLGTSYFKAGIFDKNGELKGLGRKYVEKKNEDPFCELPVSVFRKTLFECVGEAIEHAGISLNEINAVSYSSQANSFILLDHKGLPLTNLILWPDKRAKNMDIPIADNFLQKTGIGIEPNEEFAIAKILWFQKKQPGLWKQVASIMSISDYLVFKLTGQKICDYGTASMTGLFDQTVTGWWDQQLNRFHIRENQLSVPKRSGAMVGCLTQEGSEWLGLSPHTRLCLGGLDHHMAAVGAGVTRNRSVCESTGTVLACVDYKDGYAPGAGFCVAPGFHENSYFRMIFDDNSAAILEWYQKNYAPEYTLPQLIEKAATVEPGSNGLIALPCANKYPGLTGFKQTRNIQYNHGHFVRALFESIACSLHNLITKLEKTVPPPVIIPTGGGGRSSLLIKIKAERLHTTFRAPECAESACMGAAMLAAAGTKDDGDINDLVKVWIRYKAEIS
jgi:sugar (pentulose or hexulose) kinase